MKYSIDVRKVSEDVKTFIVESTSKDMARVEALIAAEAMADNWVLDKENCKYFPLTISIVED